MIDLVYPGGSVRIIGKHITKASEMLPVVDENGLVYAQAARSECHNSFLLHPVVHLHIIDRFSNIYLQRRSADKDLMPLRWDTAVGGHISFGEYAQEALVREAGEELGLYDFNPQAICSYIYNGENEHELVLVFATVGHFELTPDNSEVCDGRYWTMKEIEAAVGRSILTPQFEQEYFKIKDKLTALL